MNLYSPEYQPIVSEIKSNGERHPIEFSKIPSGNHSIETISDEELEQFEGSRLLDSLGGEWSPSEVQRILPFERITSL